MVIVKTAEQIEGIKTSCRLLAQVLLDLEAHIKPGVTPKQIDALAEKMIRDGTNKDSKMFLICKGCFIQSGSKFLTPHVEI